MEISKSIGHLLNDAARLARHDMAGRIQALGLTFPQWQVLKDLAGQEAGECCQVTMAAIARRLNTRRPNVLGILDRLEKLGLVERSVNPDNRRAHIVSLTAKAQSLIAQLQTHSRLTTNRALSGFTSAETDAVKDYLTRISINLKQSFVDGE